MKAETTVKYERVPSEYEKLATARHNRRSAQAYAIAILWAVGLILIAALIAVYMVNNPARWGVLFFTLVIFVDAAFGAAMIQGVK